MGAPTLKAKQAVNYRRGNKAKNCGNCDNAIQRKSPVDLFMFSRDARCSEIGDKPGRAYRISITAVCDKWR